jgi:DNA ligase (NAD+)
LDQLKTAAYEELAEVDGIGVIVAHSVLEWFASSRNIELLERLRQLGVVPQSEKIIAGALSGKHFAITGSLAGLEREAAAELIRQNGGIFQSSVGKNTDYLVAGSGTASNKLHTAERFGTAIISQNKLMKLLSKG